MPPSFHTILGRWKGGPDNELIRVEQGREGVVRGDWAGGKKGFEGKLIDRGTKLRGFWWDMPAGVSPANRLECTCVISLEDSDPNQLNAKLRTKGGGEDTWSAKRYSESAHIPRTDGKITPAMFKTQEVFDRLTDNGVSKKMSWTETARAEALENSTIRPFFDGAIEYIPGTAVGAEYMTMFEVERKLRKEESEHRVAVIAAMETEIASLEAKVSKGDGDVDAFKKRLDLLKRLLKGEQGAEKLKERPPFKPGLGEWHPSSGEPGDHIADPYMTEWQVMRHMRKLDEEHAVAVLEALGKEEPMLKEKIAKGEGDVDNLKKRLGFVQSTLRASKGAEKLKERPKFKPTSAEADGGGPKPFEHLPDTYFNAAELERLLKHRDEESGKRAQEMLTKEIAALEAKVAKGEGDVDNFKKRLDLCQRLLRGEKVAEKLKERPAFKMGAGAGIAGSGRLSGTVMLHPLNVRKALGASGGRY